MKKRYIAYFLGVWAALAIVGAVFGWFGSAVDVAQKEFSPKAALTKYEWFIDTSKQIERMGSDIQIYTAKQQMCGTVTDRIGREQCMLWSQELAGIKSSYNNTVAEYNAQSRKFNWDLFNVEKINPTYERR